MSAKPGIPIPGHDISFADEAGIENLLDQGTQQTRAS